MTTTEAPKLVESSAPETDVVIKLSGISKIYNLYNKKQDRLKEALHPRRKKYHREFYALKDINLEVKRGEVLGIVGKNGSGKSTLLKIIAGILTPAAGNVAVKGNIVPLLELGAGFNPEFTGIENIYFYCSLLGYTREQTDEIKDEIIAFAELGDYINQPIKTYSSGMRARLAFSVSVNVDPDILILDEVLSVGDELFRRKCHVRMQDFFESGKTVLYVAHSVATINELCSRAIMLDRGEIILEGPAKYVTSNYQKFLFAKKENIEKTRKEIIILNQNEELKQTVYRELSRDEQGQEISSGDGADFIEKAAAKMFMEEPDEQITQNAREIVAERPKLIPNFTALTTNKMINSNIEIDGFSINTLSGQEVNSLIRGEYYIFSYKITFNEPVEKINYGFGIRSDRGLPLTWRVHPGGGLFESRRVMPGETYALKWKFKCIFYPKNYYISITLRTIYKNQEIKINKVDDAFVFKVAQKATGRGGFFDSDIECEMIKIEERSFAGQ
jgi:lipopolysaccharide transport system ATP-binding protein